jgi:site-specific recombinase XerD
MSRKRAELTDDDWGIGDGGATPEPTPEPPPPSTALVPVEEDDEPLLPARLLAEAERLAQRDLADNTKRAYGQDWGTFERWCREQGRSPLPASVGTLAGYLTHMATTPTRQTGKPARPVSIGRALAAIAWVHTQKGVQEPATAAASLHRLLRGIRRELGTRQKGKAPLVWSQVKTAAMKLRIDIYGGSSPPMPNAIQTRNRAILLLGFAAALRRSEHAALKVSDLEFKPEGLVLHVGGLEEARATKGDQEAAGAVVHVPRQPSEGLECPVVAAEAWVKLLWLHGVDKMRAQEPPPEGVVQPAEGPLYRPISRHGTIIDRDVSDATIARVVKGAARLLGLNANDYSGHSLRAGFATTAAEAEIDLDLIRTHMRQKSVQTTIGYVRRAQGFTANAFGKMF